MIEAARRLLESARMFVCTSTTGESRMLVTKNEGITTPGTAEAVPLLDGSRMIFVLQNVAPENDGSIATAIIWRKVKAAWFSHARRSIYCPPRRMNILICLQDTGLSISSVSKQPRRWNWIGQLNEYGSYLRMSCKKEIIIPKLFGAFGYWLVPRQPPWSPQFVDRLPRIEERIWPAL